MTVNELRLHLRDLCHEGMGDYEVVDHDAHPIIGVSVSEDDQVDELHRVYIEAEF